MDVAAVCTPAPTCQTLRAYFYAGEDSNLHASGLTHAEYILSHAHTPTCTGLGWSLSRLWEAPALLRFLLSGGVTGLTKSLTPPHTPDTPDVIWVTLVDF